MKLWELQHDQLDRCILHCYWKKIVGQVLAAVSHGKLRQESTRRLIRSMCDVHINLDEKIEEYFCYCNNYKFSTAVCIISFFYKDGIFNLIFYTTDQLRQNLIFVEQEKNDLLYERCSKHIYQFFFVHRRLLLVVCIHSFVCLFCSPVNQHAHTQSAVEVSYCVNVFGYLFSSSTRKKHPIFKRSRLILDCLRSRPTCKLVATVLSILLVHNKTAVFTIYCMFGLCNIIF